MEIKKLQQRYAQHPAFKALEQRLQLADNSVTCLHGLNASAAPLLLSALTLALPEQAQRTFVVILDDEEQAGYFCHDLTQLMGDEEVLFFPSSYRRAVKYGQRDAANEILRTEVLARLAADQRPLFVVTHPAAVAEKVVSETVLRNETIVLKVGQTVDLREMENNLLASGFCRTDYVYEPGQFAVRGSIIDIFSFSSEFPFRIDFFDNDIDSIRTFDVQTQLSKGKLEQVSIVPEMQKQEEGREPFFQFLKDDAVVCVHNWTLTADRVKQVHDEGFSAQALMAEEAVTEMEADELVKQMNADAQFITAECFRQQTERFMRWTWGSGAGVKPDATLDFHITPQPLFHKNFDLAVQCFTELQLEGYELFILADSAKQTERLKTIFDDKDSGVTFTPVDKTLHEGFTDRTLKMAIFTDHQIFDRFHKYNLRSEHARSGKVALSLKELKTFQIGDYVVHVDHGVGRFGGLVRVPNGNTTQEMIKILYQNDDQVYVSIHSLHKVSKYKGRDSEPPKLNKLGTGAWETLKERTKKKIKDIARDLIKLYAQRKEEKGFAFSHDCFMQHELEASFLYEDTPDQLKATNDVKADMERPLPMDRLVCGDVGFGKTEVAVRAAFKAACDNKQVAVLVPTTVLAYQHFQTFTKRLKDFPVTVDYLSRARTTAQTRKVLNGLADGTINIVVGTHKLISKSVKFKDLGLLIIDEEQKFGVSTKEKLRQLKVNVDTLTMTATPIPRTLQFSLMGARDLSVIQTPPPNRYPVQTEVHTFNAEVIADAINFEMSRNGQVFFVNNRISNLQDLKALILKYVPDARVCIGHGQMNPEDLEQIVYDFVNYEYDVLLSTTIIESGIDIPNANTIIINGAQNFGLSDLHQMRGRVGRGNKKAFCYLLAPPLSALNQEARRRLQAIEVFSDLGSGIQIAMQDLDIRGAGNLLGAEQSGFIADLGYETYQKVLKEAMTELKNDEFAELYADKQEVQQAVETSDGTDYVEDCTLETDLEMFFAEDYIPGSSERMLLYRELDGLHTDEEVQTYCKRLEDRFGEIPKQGMELIRVVKLRRLGEYLGIEKVVLKLGRMSLYFVQNAKSPYYQSKVFDACINFAVLNAVRCQIKDNHGACRMVLTDVGSVAEAVDLLQQMSDLVEV